MSSSLEGSTKEGKYEMIEQFISQILNLIIRIGVALG